MNEPHKDSIQEFMIRGGKRQVRVSLLDPNLQKKLIKLISNCFFLIWYVCPVCFLFIAWTS